MMTLKLLSYNIRKGGVGREKELAAVIRHVDPDLVILQEATHRSIVERLAGETELNNFGAKRDYSLGFLSRLDVISHQWHELPPLRRAYLQVDLDGMTVFGIHLRAVHSNVTERGRVRELNALLQNIKAHAEQFHLLAGDFNTLAPGEDLDLRRLPPRLRLVAWMTGGKVRYKTIQIMLDNRYVDGYRSLRYDKGFTFPTWDPHVRLDYFFLPEKHAERLRSIEVITEAPHIKEASDHFPLLAEI